MPLPSRLTYAQIQALLPDNNTGQVSVEDVRNVVDNLCPFYGRFVMLDDGGAHVGSIVPDGAINLIGSLGWGSTPPPLNEQTIPAPELQVSGAGWFIDVTDVPGMWQVMGAGRIGIDPTFTGTIEVGVGLNDGSSAFNPVITAGAAVIEGANDLTNPGLVRFGCCLPSSAVAGRTTRFEPWIRTNPGPGGAPIQLRLYDFALTAIYVPLSVGLALP